jgi:CO dehydrogenase/acetyl-CoA synthase beta subunit
MRRECYPHSISANPAAGFATPETPVVFEAAQEGQEEQEIVEAEKEAQKAERQPINGLGQQRLTFFFIKGTQGVQLQFVHKATLASRRRYQCRRPLG